jgi:hypothetical protein
MIFHQFLNRLRQSAQSRHSARRTKECRRQSRLTFYRPYLEQLEDRIVLDGVIGQELGFLVNASGSSPGTVGDFASSLANGPLNQSLPILAGSTNSLTQILGLSSSLGTINSALNNIHPLTVEVFV